MKKLLFVSAIALIGLISTNAFAHEQKQKTPTTQPSSDKRVEVRGRTQKEKNADFASRERESNRRDRH